MKAMHSLWNRAIENKSNATMQATQMNEGTPQKGGREALNKVAHKQSPIGCKRSHHGVFHSLIQRVRTLPTLP